MMTDKDSLDVKNIVACLEKSSEELDSEVHERLLESRQAALRAMPQHARTGTQKYRLFAGALAASFVVGVVYLTILPKHQNTLQGIDVAEVEMLVDEDLLAMLQDDLEFYQYAEAEASRS
jgi:hypothetical protein